MRDIIDDMGRRRAFYFRDQYRRLVVVCLVLLVLVTGMFTYVFYQAYVEKPSDTYVTTSLGDLVRLHPAGTRDKATVALPEVINDDF